MNSFVVVLLLAIWQVSAGSVAVNLYANWTDSSFPVQLVEAVASHNETLYAYALKTLLGNSGEESDWNDSEDNAEDIDGEIDGDVDTPIKGGFVDITPKKYSSEAESGTDEALYNDLASQLTPTQVGFLNLNLVNSIYSPRIQAHYDHYVYDVQPELEALVQQQCATDSFGENIENPLGAWVKYGSRIYCSEQDLFALQLEGHSEPILAFDRTVGSDLASPVLAFYGSPESDRFAGMLSTLYSLAEAGNLQFVWRYVPPKTPLPLPLSGYGKTLTVKSNLKKAPIPNELKKSHSRFLENFKSSKLYSVAHEALPHISTMLAAVVLDTKPAKRFEKLSILLKNFPKYAPHLKHLQKPSNFDAVSRHAKANEKLGASRDLTGMFINGAIVHRLETDLPYVIKKLEKEVVLIEDMEKLGFTKSQAKKLFSKFALLSAYKENEYRTGSSHNRYALYKETFDAKDPFSGGVVFFNDLGIDDNYNLYSPDRYKVYIEEAAQFRHGQIPPLKENVHDIIFVMNFSNKSQLKVFFAMSKMILDKGIPQQLGILPLVVSEKDARITEMFYHILEVGELTEALALLYKYYDAKAEEEEALFSLVTNSEKKHYTQYQNTIDKYSILEPSVVLNGVIVDMRSSNWQAQMGQQIVHDVKLLQNSIRQGHDQRKPLKEALYLGSKSHRNLKITPKDPGNIRYKRVTSELTSASVAFQKVVDSSQPSITFWLIGDFNSNLVLDQLKSIFKFMRQYNGRSTQVRVLNTAKEAHLLDGLVDGFSGKALTSQGLKKLVSLIGDTRIQVFSEPDSEKLKILEANYIQSHQSILLFNSRQFRLDSALEPRELQQIVAYEFPQRLDTIDEILNAYPQDFEYQSILDLKPTDFNDMDWYDHVSSIITESFNLEDSIVRTDVARYDFSSLDFANSIDLTGYDKRKSVDILVTLDPVDIFSQKLISMVGSLRDLPFVNILLLLQPLSTAEEPAGLNTFYASGYSSSLPKFNSEGQFVRSETESFENIPEASYSVDIDVPTRWGVVRNESSSDLDFNQIDVTGNDQITADYILEQIAVEAFVVNVRNGVSVPGLTFEAIGQRGYHEALTMETLGYTQLRLEPGVWQFSKKSDPSTDAKYDLLSASANKYIASDSHMKSTPITVFSLHGELLHVRTKDSMSGSSSALKHVKSKHADVNVFSIASGLSYEKLMAIMMLSVKAHTKKTLKFWLLEDFLSSQFRAQLPILAAAYNFQYELVSYKWPIWLRQQAEAHRAVWAYKILFLDVLFPADLEKIIFVDADQIARTDLYELTTLDLNGAPYGFTPMCDSRKDMDGFRFWQQGYWKTVLKDDLKYHISALFVVDLKNLRENTVGDKLRSHYQKLSSDPNSLSNLDQDLPNNLQRNVPIFSLPQEWLWCETWCAQSEKKHAKMIDLCNDPTSSESKIAKAIRSIPEWKGYNENLQEIGDGKLRIAHDEL